ncbi:MAG: SpoVR family protein [Crenarchaeota archaeon]|nr:MAG: SpoVR family protein [Thermoproteota archaeon]
MSNDFLHGSSLLLGDNTVPGVQIPEELKKLIPDIFKACKDFGLDFYPTVVQMLAYDEISEIASYGGFPVRYPHWKWGMEYEELQKGYMYGMHRIYELVINTNPCYIYCLDSNALVDNVTVIAHALGHNDFFKNNIFFSPTSQNMMNQLANHGTRVRKYMARWGRSRVTDFIDHCLRIETLIDFSTAWEKRKVKQVTIKDSRKYRHPRRLETDRDYMEPYINTEEWKNKQKQKIERKDAFDELEIFNNPTKNIMGFLRDHAPLKAWQSDVLSMLYQEALYFAPQRLTKMANEGWASFVDYNIMCKYALCGLGQKTPDSGIIQYSKHKMGVLGGKHSTNPYKLGFCLFQDIEERWNKGRFGTEYEECDDLEKKRKWDTNVGLGQEKVFEVRKHYNDLTMLAEFFTPEFCNKYEFFNWKRHPNGDIMLENRNFREIKTKLLRKYANGGLPEIFLVDPNHRGKRYMLLQHRWEGQTLLPKYVEAVMQSLYFFWNNDVYLATKDKDGNEIVWAAYGVEDGLVECMTREKYEESMKRK